MSHLGKEKDNEKSRRLQESSSDEDDEDSLSLEEDEASNRLPQTNETSDYEDTSHNSEYTDDNSEYSYQTAPSVASSTSMLYETPQQPQNVLLPGPSALLKSATSLLGSDDDDDDDDDHYSESLETDHNKKKKDDTTKQTPQGNDAKINEDNDPERLSASGSEYEMPLAGSSNNNSKKKTAAVGSSTTTVLYARGTPRNHRGTQRRSSLNSSTSSTSSPSKESPRTTPASARSTRSHRRRSSLTTPPPKLLDTSDNDDDDDNEHDEKEQGKLRRRTSEKILDSQNERDKAEGKMESKDKAEGKMESSKEVNTTRKGRQRSFSGSRKVPVPPAPDSDDEKDETPQESPAVSRKTRETSTPRKTPTRRSSQLRLTESSGEDDGVDASKTRSVAKTPEHKARHSTKGTSPNNLVTPNKSPTRRGRSTRKLMTVPLESPDAGKGAEKKSPPTTAPSRSKSRHRRSFSRGRALDSMLEDNKSNATNASTDDEDTRSRNSGDGGIHATTRRSSRTLGAKSPSRARAKSQHRRTLGRQASARSENTITITSSDDEGGTNVKSSRSRSGSSEAGSSSDGGEDSKTGRRLSKSTSSRRKMVRTRNKRPVAGAEVIVTLMKPKLLNNTDGSSVADQSATTSGGGLSYFSRGPSLKQVDLRVYWKKDAASDWSLQSTRLLKLLKTKQSAGSSAYSLEQAEVQLEVSVGCERTRNWLQSMKNEPVMELRLGEPLNSTTRWTFRELVQSIPKTMVLQRQKSEGAVAVAASSLLSSKLNSGKPTSTELGVQTVWKAWSMPELAAGVSVSLPTTRVQLAYTAPDPISMSILAVDQTRGKLVWEESFLFESDKADDSSKSGSLVKEGNQVNVTLDKVPSTIAAIFIFAHNSSSTAAATCRLQRQVDEVGLLQWPPIQAEKSSLMARVSRGSEGSEDTWEMAGWNQSFTLIPEMGALIPELQRNCLDVIVPAGPVLRTANLSSGQCVNLRSYCGNTLSLVVDVRSKKGSIMAVLLDNKGNKVDAVFAPQHVKSRDRSMSLTGKLMEVELDKVSSRVQMVGLALTKNKEIETPLTTDNWTLQVWDPTNESQVIRYYPRSTPKSPGEVDPQKDTVLLGSFWRRSTTVQDWNFWALGESTASRTEAALVDEWHNLSLQPPRPLTMNGIGPLEMPEQKHSSKGLLSEIPREQLALAFLGDAMDKIS